MKLLFLIFPQISKNSLNQTVNMINISYCYIINIHQALIVQYDNDIKPEMTWFYVQSQFYNLGSRFIFIIKKRWLLNSSPFIQRDVTQPNSITPLVKLVFCHLICQSGEFKISVVFSRIYRIINSIVYCELFRIS